MNTITSKLAFVDYKIATFPKSIQAELEYEASKRCYEIFVEMDGNVREAVKQGSIERYCWIDEILEEYQSYEPYYSELEKTILSDYEHSDDDYEDSWIEAKARLNAIAKAICACNRVK